MLKLNPFVLRTEVLSKYYLTSAKQTHNHYDLIIASRYTVCQIRPESVRKWLNQGGMKAPFECIV